MGGWALWLCKEFVDQEQNRTCENCVLELSSCNPLYGNLRLGLLIGANKVQAL